MSQEEHTLIDLVHKLTHLWDKGHMSYKDKIAVDNAWKTISEIMGIDGYDEIGRNPLAITCANTTDIREYPFMASIHVNLLLVCGGVIINPNLILTAARCVDNVSTDSLLVYVGSVSSWLVGKHGIRNVSDKYTNKDYNSQTYRNDICLLLLGQRLDYTEKINAINLPPFDMKLEEDQTVRLLGFGETERGFSLGGLRLAKFTILNDNTCQKQCGFPLESQFCAGAEGISKLLKGDGGSPILRKTSLVGIVSWFQGGYAVAVRILDYMEFILATMNKQP